MKKKIAFFTLSMRRGGAERVIANLCNELIKHYEIHLLLFDKELDYTLDERIKISFLTTSGDPKSNLFKLLSLPFFSFKLRRWLKKNNIDILFSFLFRPNIISTLSKPWNRKIKIVISERSNPWLQYSRNTFGNKINRILIKHQYPKADLITVNSFGSKYALHRYYGIKNEEIKIIRNPINQQFYRQNTGTMLSGKFIYVTVGRLDEGKNHSLLLEVAHNLVKRGIHDFELWIIGGGPLEQLLKEKTNSLNLGHHIKFLGYVSEVSNYLAKSNAFVFSSRREGFPNVLLEAMASGIPVISTDCAYGPREIIEDRDVLPNNNLMNIEQSKNGILVPVDNVEAMTEAFLVIYKNEDLSLSLTSAYDSSLGRYNLSTIVKDYLFIIEKLY